MTQNGNRRAVQSAILKSLQLMIEIFHNAGVLDHDC
jgi:hypothetical protein